MADEWDAIERQALQDTYDKAKASGDAKALAERALARAAKKDRRLAGRSEAAVYAEIRRRFGVGGWWSNKSASFNFI